jgi:hypothetical protein
MKYSEQPAVKTLNYIINSGAKHCINDIKSGAYDLTMAEAEAVHLAALQRLAIAYEETISQILSDRYAERLR